MTSEWIEVSAGPARHPALSLPETRPEDVRSRRTSDLIEVSLFAVTVVLTGLLAEAASLKILQTPMSYEMKAIGGQPDYALGSVHAVTRDGTLVIASASGSQLASYAWGAANVIFVVGAQKLVPTLEAAHERINEYSLKLEDARACAAHGQHSVVGKVLEIHQEQLGRIGVVLIRHAVGF